MKAQKTVSHVDTAVTPASYVPKLRRFSNVGHIDMPNYPRPMFKTGELNTHRGVVAAPVAGPIIPWRIILTEGGDKLVAEGGNAPYIQFEDPY